MSTVAEPEIAERNGKPTKSPVIRRTLVNEDDFNTRLMNRFIPASVISGALHVIVIGGMIWMTAGAKKAESKEEEALITTQVEEPKDTTENLTNEDIGLDADLAASTAVDREENVNVLAPKSDEPVGLNDQPNETAPQTQIAGPDMNAGIGSIGDLTDKGLMTGEGGGGGAFTVPGMQGRMSGATKDKLLRDNGGNTASEAAVASGLNWLARKQLPDGSWEYDGSYKDKVSATGLALLPFLAAGETHKQGKKYKKTVEDGLNWLMGRVGANGTFAGATVDHYMYAHAIATVALCEATGMTRDPKVKERATAAVNFIVRAQSKGNGSWGYKAGIDGDTSIVGWQIQALASARLAEIRFDREKVYKDAEKFLTSSVSVDSGAKYGYRNKMPPAETIQTMTPVGLLCRYYMGWTPKNPAFARGIDYLIKTHPPGQDAFNIYYYYYATQVMHFYEGPEWHKVWNPKMRDLLIGLQDKSGDEKLKGSWAKDSSLIGSNCGRHGTTVLALLTLEVYYRHLPLYKRDSAGLAELER